MKLQQALSETPLVAILRGVTPDEVVAIGEALYSVGFRAIEVPLNSPDPYASIERLCAALGSRCLCGAGTVLRVDQVEAVAAAGGRLIVTPNINPEVIARAVAMNLEVLPGFATATEAFAAAAAGAGWLKLFPASTYGHGHFAALKAVLPVGTGVLAVGGVGAENAREWLRAGAAGIGAGSDIYRPGDSVADVTRRAAELVALVRPLQRQ